MKSLKFDENYATITPTVFLLVLDMKKLLGIVVVFAVLMLTTLTSCDSPYEDCYKENKKALIKKGRPKAEAAQRAKAMCS